MTTRQEAYDAIDSERSYQDSIWQDQGHPEQPNPLTVGEFILMLEKYTEFARTCWVNEPKPEIETLKIIRKIAAIAVNCMEQNGVLKR